MKSAFRFVSLLLLALWLPATLHCDLEAAGLAHAALTCQDDHAPDAHAADNCRLIEDGHYQGSVVLLKTSPTPFVWLAVLFAPVPVAPEPTLLPLSPARSTPPLELSPTWTFARRAALPARAPNPVA